MYEQYILEREGLETINTDFGFISFRVNEGVFFISDWFVKPERRGDKQGYVLANMAFEVAKEKGCKVASCQVDINAIDATRSLAAILGYGFKLYQIDNNRFIHLFKEVENG